MAPPKPKAKDLHLYVHQSALEICQDAAAFCHTKNIPHKFLDCTDDSDNFMMVKMGLNPAGTPPDQRVTEVSQVRWPVVVYKGVESFQDGNSWLRETFAETQYDSDDEGDKVPEYNPSLPTLYCKTNCGLCRYAKAYLTQNGIQYNQKNIKTSKAANDEMWSYLRSVNHEGRFTMPVLRFRNDKGGQAITTNAYPWCKENLHKLRATQPKQEKPLADVWTRKDQQEQCEGDACAVSASPSGGGDNNSNRKQQQGKEDDGCGCVIQ